MYAPAQSNVVLMKSHWGRSVVLTDGQGIPDQVDGLQELYDGITNLIWTTLADAREMDLGKSILVKVGVKLAHLRHTQEDQILKNLRPLLQTSWDGSRWTAYWEQPALEHRWIM